MPLVRPETVWVSEVEVLVMVVQLLSQALSFFLYSHRVSAALPPVIEEEMVSLPLPAPTAAVGVDGFGGRVRKDVCVLSDVEQPLSL